MKPKKAYEWLVNHSTEVSRLESMRALLAWDQRACIPPAGYEHRAAQFAFIAQLLSARLTDPRMGEMLETVEGSRLVEDPAGAAAVNVREWRKTYDRASRIPHRLSVELARAVSESEIAWQKAKGRDDWDSFRPYLDRVVDLKREEAGLLNWRYDCYDGLLNDYEPGETARALESMFAELRVALIEILERIEGSSRRPDVSVVQNRFPPKAQRAFAREVVSEIGFNFESGRVDSSAHPFTVMIGPGDIRFTTRYDEYSFATAFFGAVHEAGHALYDQGLLPEHWGTPMGKAVSMGIHESQALLWENIVCRSFGFWKRFFPKAEKYFSSLAGVTLDDFHSAINDVRRTLIRMDADEVTYNLHVLLRFEIELALMRREIEVNDLPDVWNEKMEEYLGISPPDYRSGVMQDIHWSEGAIGYFPTYALGNMYAAQFYAAAEGEIGDLEDLFAQGDFETLGEWLRRRVYAHGSRYEPMELVRKATGEELSPRRLIDYLDRKFGALYGF